jgi:HEAT repeat protein
VSLSFLIHGCNWWLIAGNTLRFGNISIGKRGRLLDRELDNRRSFDDAGPMAPTQPNYRLLAAAALALTALAGCGKTPVVPAKSISVDAGEKPVLTSVERRDRTLSRQPQTDGVTRASFEQPIIEPEPIKPLAAWTEQEAAAEALGRIGAAAVPALVESLQNPDAAVRLKAIEVLGRMGADAKDAVPHLIRLLDDPDLNVRKAAARTLGRIGPAAQQAVPSLMKTLLEPAPLAPAP